LGRKGFSMHIVKSIGVLSVAKIMGLIYGCMGLLFAPLFLLIGMAGVFADQNKNPLAGMVGVFLTLVMPVLYGAMGFVMGAIGALLYNLFAKLVGGFELELEVNSQALVAPYPLVPPPTAGV
jgi:hypothetical protein